MPGAAEAEIITVGIVSKSRNVVLVSDKGISFHIWLQETVWDTVFGCQDVGI